MTPPAVSRTERSAPVRWLAAAVAWWTGLPIGVRACLPPAVMLFLWWSSSRQPTGGESSIVKALLHNSAHVFVYGALAAAWWMVLWRRSPAPYLGVVAWVLSVAYGVVDELHQAAVPGRTCSLGDLGSDAAGAWLAILSLRWLQLVEERSRRMMLLAAISALLAVLVATFLPV